MDYFLILWALIGAGLGGLGGTFAAARLKEKKQQLGAIAAACLVGAIVIPLLASAIFARPGVQKYFQKSGSTLEAHAGYRKAIRDMSQEQVRNFTRQKAQLGLKRLSLKDLRRWNELRLKMVETSPILCAGFWTGRGTSVAAVRAVLETFPPADIADWTQISVHAAILEIDQFPYPVLAPESMQNGIAMIARKLSKTEVQRMQTTLLAAAKAKDADACWTMKTFLRGAMGLPQNIQDQFIRGLASI